MNKLDTILQLTKLASKAQEVSTQNNLNKAQEN